MLKTQQVGQFLSRGFIWLQWNFLSPSPPYPTISPIVTDNVKSPPPIKNVEKTLTGMRISSWKAGTCLLLSKSTQFLLILAHFDVFWGSNYCMCFSSFFKNHFQTFEVPPPIKNLEKPWCRRLGVLLPELNTDAWVETRVMLKWSEKRLVLTTFSENLQAFEPKALPLDQFV